MKKLLTLILASSLGLVSYATYINPSSGEPSLQSIINGSVVGPSINVNTDQVALDSYWNSAGSSDAGMLVEYAGYAGDNTFGIYKKGSPGTKQQIFAGSVGGPTAPSAFIIPAGWGDFGFYMYNAAQNFTWYSDSSLNAGGGLDHFVFFQGATGDTLHGWSFDSNDYVIGIEDLNLGDQDYNDMVVLVQNIKVPESSSTLILLGLALSGLAFVRRKAA